MYPIHMICNVSLRGLMQSLMKQIDKEGANVERAMQEMNEAGLLPEDWGGDTPFVPVRICQHHPPSSGLLCSHKET